MAIELGETSGTLKRSERTFRIEIDTPLGGVPIVRIYRELVRELDGLVVREVLGTVERSLPQVAASEVSVKARKYSGAQMAEAIAAFADQWRSEDIASEAAERARNASLPQPEPAR